MGHRGSHLGLWKPQFRHLHLHPRYVEQVPSTSSAEHDNNKQTTVKQVIGQAEILPWSKIWKQDDPIHRGGEDSPRPNDYIHKAPQGGLIIHWIMSVVFIAASSSIPSTLESISIPGYFQTYLHSFLLSRSSRTPGLPRLHVPILVRY